MTTGDSEGTTAAMRLPPPAAARGPPEHPAGTPEEVSLSPWGFVHLVDLLLSALLPRHHLFHDRSSTVMTGRGMGSCDAQLLVSPPRALASLSTTAGTGCAAVSSACSHHNEATRLGSHKKQRSPRDTGQRVIVQNAQVVVVVVVVVLTVSYTMMT